jgi:hypothetical protein
MNGKPGGTIGGPYCTIRPNYVRKKKIEGIKKPPVT